MHEHFMRRIFAVIIGLLLLGFAPTAMAQVPPTVQADAKHLDDVAPEVAAAAAAGDWTTASSGASQSGGAMATLDGLMATLERAICATDRQDVAQAQTGVRAFQTQWLD